MQIHVPKTVKGEIIRIGIRYNVDFSVLNINNFSLIQLSSLWLRDCSLSQDKKKIKMKKVTTTWMKLMKNYLAKVPKVQKGPNLIK